MKKSLLLAVLAFTFLLTSCGKNSDEEVKDAIIEANVYLTKGECLRAIEILEALGDRSSNAVFVKTLASAYACKANYSTIYFFQHNISLLGSAPTVLGGTTLFNTSFLMSSPVSSSYVSLKKAVEVLLYAGGIPKGVNPTLALREGSFTEDELKELHSFLVYLLTSNIGQYLKFYGNALSGTKGDGSGTNTCLANYDNVNFSHPDFGNLDIQTFLGLDQTGSCTSLNSGSSDLGATGTLDVERMCQGTVLINNLMEILPAFLADFSGSDFDDLGSFLGELAIVRNNLDQVTPSLDDVSSVLSLEKCVADNSTDSSALQVYFSLVFETLFL